MFRTLLKLLSLFVIPLIVGNASSADAGFRITGYCQNLIINGNDFTKECNPEFNRYDHENGRINYAFYVPNKGFVIFAGENEVSDGLNMYSRVEIDKVYINEVERPIDGVCAILGNADYGFTVSCRSNDNQRKYSALFFSYGKTKKLY